MIKYLVLLLFCNMFLSSYGLAQDSSATRTVTEHQYNNSDKDNVIDIGSAFSAMVRTSIGQQQEINRSKIKIVNCQSCNIKINVTAILNTTSIRCPNCRRSFSL